MTFSLQIHTVSCAAKNNELYSAFLNGRCRLILSVGKDLRIAMKYKLCFVARWLGVGLNLSPHRIPAIKFLMKINWKVTSAFRDTTSCFLSKSVTDDFYKTLLGNENYSVYCDLLEGYPLCMLTTLDIGFKTAQ